MITTLIILALSAVFFVNGKIRSDLVALCALVLLMVFNILTPEEALSGFSNSVVIMMVGLFVVGGAIFKTGLAKMIGSKILHLAGTSEIKLFILIMLVTAFIGAFVSNTGTVALMLPIVVSMAVNANISPSRFLMPLAFASSMGGMATLIGIVCITVGLIVLIPLSKWFLSKKEDTKKNDTSTRRSPQELSKKYSLSDNLYRVRVHKDSLVKNKKLHELNITSLYNLTILEIRRKSSSQSRFMKTVDQKLAGPETEIQEEDILYVFGDYHNIDKFVKENRLDLTESKVSEFTGDNEKLSVREIGIAEVLLMPDSKLINRAVKDSGFRDKYSVNILGIERGNEYILSDVKDIKMHAGDILLIQGTWDDIARMSKKQSQWVVLGQPVEEASKVTLDYKAPVAAGIMVLMIAAMVFDFIPIPPVAAVLIAAILMVLTGCFRNVEDAYKTINWESIVLIAAMLPMSLALEKTGASSLISERLVGGLGNYGPLVLMAGIYFTTSLLTMFISNTATAVLVAPIALQSAISIGVSPYPFLLAVTVGASMCFASPFSTPPNALVMSAGKYTFMDYVKVGLPLQIIMGIIMIFVLPLLFPF